MFKSFVVLSVLAAPVLSQTAVSLLVDFAGYQSSGTLNLRSTLQSVSARKGAPFMFGSTYDTYDSDQSFYSNVFSTFFNHVVAENGCKWDATEPSRGTSSLTECQGVQSFAAKNGNSFRGHNTFWHSQTPVSYPFIFTDLLLFLTKFFSLGSREASQQAISLPTSSLNTSSRRSREWDHPSPPGML